MKIQKNEILTDTMMFAIEVQCLSNRWMRDSLSALKGAIEKFNRGEEGDFKQALLMADHATEVIMRNCLIFIQNETPPYDYPTLLKIACKKAKVPTEIAEEIITFRLIRDGFSHHNIEKISKGLKGTTTGLTIEKSCLEDYLRAISKLFEHLTGDSPLILILALILLLCGVFSSLDYDC